eukprot:1707993-Rhodomonas_salina.2
MPTRLSGYPVPGTRVPGVPTRNFFCSRCKSVQAPAVFSLTVRTLVGGLGGPVVAMQFARGLLGLGHEKKKEWGPLKFRSKDSGPRCAVDKCKNSTIKEFLPGMPLDNSEGGIWSCESAPGSQLLSYPGTRVPGYPGTRGSVYHTKLGPKGTRGTWKGPGYTVWSSSRTPEYTLTRVPGPIGIPSTIPGYTGTRGTAALWFLASSSIK